MTNKFDAAHAATLEAIKKKAPIIYQAALQDGDFAGYADFLKLDASGKYQAWDTKLALSPKPYYPIQLCCYSEMLAAATGQGMPERIGVILGDGDRNRVPGRGFHSLLPPHQRELSRDAGGIQRKDGRLPGAASACRSWSMDLVCGEILSR